MVTTRTGKFLLNAARACTAGILLLAFSARADSLIHTEMQQGLEAERITGAVWALVTPDAGTAIGAAGLKHAGSREPMSADNKVRVGSVAKTVLAMGVLRMVSAGQLSLDTEVTTLLPALKLRNPWGASDPVRVRHLLDHTAGLENFRFSQIYTLKAQPNTPLSSAMDRIPMLVVRSRPGSQYAYSSTGYLLLGMIIEAVSSEPYERYLDTHLLQPLGMHNSTFQFTTQDADPLLAMGHFENGVTQESLPTYLRPAEQFTTTAADMARFASFLMGNGTVDGIHLIAPELLASLSRPASTDAALAGLRTGHGLALAVRDRHGAMGHCHPGTTFGFRAMFCLYPEQRKAFFIAFNADIETADYERFNKSLIKELRLEPRRPPQLPRAAPQGIEQWEGIYVPAWHAVAGLAWLDTVFNFRHVQWDGGRLAVNSLQHDPLSLRPAGGMLFLMEGRTEPSHVLLASAQGNRVLSDGLRNYRKVAWTTMIWLWMSTVLGVMGLFYVLLAGLWQLIRGRMRASGVLAVPLASVAALVLPLPLFFAQSFLQLGERTAASVSLAIATFLLLVGMAVGLLRLLFARHAATRRPVLECIALLAVLQWLIVLAVWGMIPFVLWE